MQNYGGGIHIPIESILELIPDTPGNKRMKSALSSEDTQRQLAAAQAAQIKAVTDRLRAMTPAELAQVWAQTGLVKAQTTETTRMTEPKVENLQAQTGATKSQTGINEMLAPIQGGKMRAEAGESTARAGLYNTQSNLMPRQMALSESGAVSDLLRTMVGNAGIIDMPVMDAKGNITGYQPNPMKELILNYIQQLSPQFINKTPGLAPPATTAPPGVGAGQTDAQKQVMEAVQALVRGNQVGKFGVAAQSQRQGLPNGGATFNDPLTDALLWYQQNAPQVLGQAWDKWSDLVSPSYQPQAQQQDRKRRGL